MIKKLSVSIKRQGTVNANIPNVIMTGGTSDYNKLKNKPSIDGVTVEGDHSADYYGLTSFWFGTRAEYNALTTILPNVCYCIEEGT